MIFRVPNHVFPPCNDTDLRLRLATNQSDSQLDRRGGEGGGSFPLPAGFPVDNFFYLKLFWILKIASKSKKFVKPDVCCIWRETAIRTGSDPTSTGEGDGADRKESESEISERRGALRRITASRSRDGLRLPIGPLRGWDCGVPCAWPPSVTQSHSHIE